MSARTLMAAALAIVLIGWAVLADTVPTEVQQPGTQPNEVGSLETPDKCDNCHGGYDPSVEPAYNWRGSMMASAGRDPLFWATLAVAEQDFDGAGDLCIRCHSPAGWIDGRSTPTDGSALMDKDADGVQCDLCHTMTNPDKSEHLGVQNPPFNAYDDVTGEGYYGSGMYVLWPQSSKLGPYPDAVARHQFLQSLFHRADEFCGTCHDVSNPVIGDLAYNNGTQPTADPVIFSGIPGSDVSTKAAFNNLPFQYGIVERTYSEFKSSLIDDTRVKDYFTLPSDLQGGALLAGYESALSAGTDGDYEDNTPRFYTCQTCHLRPVVGPGADKPDAPQRKDLPLHDMTGGNYWVPDAIQYLDQLGLLRLGGGLTATQTAALNAGKTRALKQLNEAATLSVIDNTVKIVNHTGHKLISGYPEGRRMWLNIKWMDEANNLVSEDGAYGWIDVVLDGVPTQVMSLIDPYDPNTKIYEGHYALTQEWAQQLRFDFGYAPDLPLTFDRYTGLVEYTLQDLADGIPGSYLKTFHFVLNNKVAKDNRIPPYGMSYDEARRRNALPVPADQYGNPGAGGIYDYWDEFALSPPAGAVYATIDLLYQPTSWEYIQFLYLANQGLNPFLADEGVYLLDAWLNTGMAEPYVMASTIWGTAPVPATPKMIVNSLATWCTGKGGQFTQPCDTFRARDTIGWIAVVLDEFESPVSGAQVFTEIRDASEALVTEKQGFTDANGEAPFTWRIPRGQAPGVYTVNVANVLHASFEYDAAGSVTQTPFTIQ
ncbi:MAG: hypothetical protein JSU87_06460 [Gemmatimonadota bacterium]|nr:MAG: hypothetical protein JSU87_06460 [Gemmatimonadota bacterium]